MKKLKLLVIPLLAFIIGISAFRSSPKPEVEPSNSYKPIYIYPITDKFSGSYTKIQGPVTYHNLHDTVITGKWYYGDISQNKPNVTLINCSNVTFRNDLVGQPFYIGNQNDGINTQGCSNITIQNCYFENTSTGVHAFTTQTIKVDSCQAKNMQGPFPLGGDFAQMNRISGPNCSVSYNKVENFNFTGHQEDMINLYGSNGTPTSPIRVVGNKLRGGGPSTSGSGITVGDGPSPYDGHTRSSYELVFGNIVVNSGFCGIQCAGGTYIQIQQNYIYSKATPYSHVGLGYSNFGGYPSTHITYTGNYVNWTAGLPADLQRGQPVRRDTSIHRPLPAGTTIPTNWKTNIVGVKSLLKDATMLPVQLLTTANPIH